MKWWLAVLCLCVSSAYAQAQTDIKDREQQANDLIQALKQQREEAQDKLVNAYVTIMKLQRELDRLKVAPQTEGQKAPKADDAPPK